MADPNPGIHPYDPPKLPIEEHPFGAYARAVKAVSAAGIPHLVGGGLAVAQYGRERATKDLDLFIRRTDTGVTMNALSAAGFTTLETDFPWLRKAQTDGVFIDLIVWSAGPIALSLEEVERGWPVEIAGVPMRIFAPEDMLLRKIYVMRDEGPDWVDAFSIIERTGGRLEWSYLRHDDLDPRLLAAFLLAAAVRLPGAVPPHVVAEHVDRARARATAPRCLTPGH